MRKFVILLCLVLFTGMIISKDTLNAQCMGFNLGKKKEPQAKPQKQYVMPKWVKTDNNGRYYVVQAFIIDEFSTAKRKKTKY